MKIQFTDILRYNLQIYKDKVVKGRQKKNIYIYKYINKKKHRYSLERNSHTIYRETKLRFTKILRQSFAIYSDTPGNKGKRREGHLKMCLDYAKKNICKITNQSGHI